MCKAKLTNSQQSSTPDLRSYVLVTAGSRQEANVYLVNLSANSSTQPSISHLTHFVKATDVSKKEQSDQDLRIMATVALETAFGVFVCFGTSAGVIEWYGLNMIKKRLVRRDSL